VRNREISIDLYETFTHTITLKQFDNTVLKINLYAKRELFPVDDCTFILTAVRADGATVKQLTDIAPAGNALTVTLDPRIVAVDGQIKLEIAIFNASGKLISTFVFSAVVEPSLTGDDAAESSDIANMLFLSTKAPYIDALTKNWMIFDDETGMFINSGMPSQGTGGGSDFIKLVRAEDWTEQSESLYTVTITPTDHSMGLAAYVSDVERLRSDGVYTNVSYGYDRQPDGVITIMSNVAYDGRIIVKE
jgi:hypothetical protein